MGISGPKNGNYVYVMNNEDDTVSVIDTSDNSVSSFQMEEGSVLIALGSFVGGVSPAAPTNLTIDDSSEDQIDLSWTDNAYDELGFTIERKIYGEDEFVRVAVVGSNVNEYSDTGLNSYTTYTYRILAYNDATDSEYSDEVLTTTDVDESSVNCFISSSGYKSAKIVIIYWLLFVLVIFSGIIFSERLISRKTEE